MDTFATQHLLRRVARRQRLASLGRQLHLFVLILACIYAVLLLVSRLLGLIPNWFRPGTLAIVVGMGLILALVFNRRPTDTETARLVDVRMRTDDLFLTATLIESSLGQFQPVVRAQVEEKADTVMPGEVVPFRWRTKTRDIASALSLLLVAIFLLPQLDPFGKGEERQHINQRQRRLEKSRRLTALRTQLLTRKANHAEQSKEVKQAIEELKLTFNRMKPTDKTGNLKRLTEQQRKLGKLWRDISEEKLKNALTRVPPSQMFGGRDLKKTSRWKQELQEGKATGIKKELADLKKLAEQFQEESDSLRGEKIRQELERRLRVLSEFMGAELNAGPVNAALERALQQLQLSGIKGLSRQALQALCETLNLSEKELENLLQSLQNLQELEQALRTLQLAKALNLMQGLDGKACAGCQGIGAYAALYAQLQAQLQTKIGPGMRGPGVGQGGEAPENPMAQTSFKTELSRSALQAGKVLMQLKTQGLSDPGRAREDYLHYVTEVKQGISEAILQEQVPPGYHQTIKKYFDKMEGANAKPSQE